jgi:hypothetical protein
MWGTEGQAEAITIAESELPTKEEGALFIRAIQAHLGNLLQTSKGQVRQFLREVWQEAKARERADRRILQEDY